MRRRLVHRGAQGRPASTEDPSRTPGQRQHPLTFIASRPNPNQTPRSLASGAVVAHKVDISKHVITATGADYYKVNPKGNVPCLVLEDGTILNEGAATLQWLADQAPGAALAAANGTTARYVLINTLNYLASEVHATYGPLFGPGTDEFKAAQKAKLATKFEYVSKTLLGEKPFLGGAEFSIADSYFFVMTGWAGYVGFDLAAFPSVQAYQARCAELAFVKEAQAAMAAAP